MQIPLASAAIRSLCIFPFLASLLLPGSSGVAQDTPESDPPHLASQLDRIISDYLEAEAIPGLAIGVVRDGRRVYAKGFGVADPETGRAVTSSSLFHLASISKVFVATGVMQLVEAGKIDLDAPVVEYLPYFELDDERSAEITVRQLLTHTSGMPDVRDYQWGAPERDDEALERYVRGLSGRELRSAPGEECYYSNMAFEVLGDLIAKVSGKTFEAAMHDGILGPLKMSTSTFLESELDPKLRTTPHVGRRKPEVSELYPYNRAHAPSSTLHSSVDEMCNWIIACTGRGALTDAGDESEGETRILTSASFDELWKPHVLARRGRHYGLAWMLGDSPRGLWVFHGGRDPGFRTHLSIFPDEGVGIIILSNYSETPIPPLRDALIEAVAR